MDVMLALHLWPHLPHGTVGVKYGAVTASCDDFTFEIEGKGGHSARPHQAVDAIAISGQILQALSMLVTKANNPVDPVVVHVGKIQGGTANNVIADRVVLEGTTRAVSFETRKKLRNQLIQLVEAVASSFGGTAKVHFTEGHPPVVNDERLTRMVEEGAKEILGSNRVLRLQDPSMGADDFGAFAEIVPSTYFRLGVDRGDGQAYDLHHPHFQFDDSIIPIGVKLFTWIVLSRLQEGVEKRC